MNDITINTQEIDNSISIYHIWSLANHNYGHDVHKNGWGRHYIKQNNTWRKINHHKLEFCKLIYAHVIKIDKNYEIRIYHGNLHKLLYYNKMIIIKKD